jgi:hypothetical protein
MTLILVITSFSMWQRLTHGSVDTSRINGHLVFGWSGVLIFSRSPGVVADTTTTGRGSPMLRLSFHPSNVKNA